MGRLDGKVAVITGGASGIGEASARRFVSEGARVVIADIHRERGESVAASMGDACRFVTADVSRAADVEAAVAMAVDAFGRLDVMFNNAGVMGGEGPIAQASEERWERIIMVNLKGPWLGMRAALPHLIAGGGGSIISTSSHAADMGIPERGAYASSKNGVQGLTRVCAIENARHNVRANCVVPGATLTGMVLGGTLERPEAIPDTPELRAELAALHALPRPGMPEDIANAALFLASDESSFITGQTIVVDGGWAASPRLPLSSIDGQHLMSRSTKVAV
jgi:NAD(P)-dependent dehydrogenase (short-subunit alcohol dehydrogenase family)